jgi:acetyl-CoA carboxylase carboxyl transferase subunit alpha
MKITFDFEKPLAELLQQIEKVKQVEDKNKLDMSATLAELENKLEATKQQIYGNLTGWQRVQISRHPERPYSLQYLELMCDDFIELHGDRTVGDDKAIIGYVYRSPERAQYQGASISQLWHGQPRRLPQGVAIDENGGEV